MDRIGKRRNYILSFPAKIALNFKNLYPTFESIPKTNYSYRL